MEKKSVVILFSFIVASLPALVFSQTSDWHTIKSTRGTSALLVPAKPVSIAASSKGNLSTVKGQAHDLTLATLQQQGAISSEYELGTPTRTAIEGHTIVESYPVSYNGIPLQDKMVAATIGASNQAIVSIEHSLRGYRTGIQSPSITTDAITSSTNRYLGDGMSFVKMPTLVYREDKSSGSLQLCYEVFARDNTRGSWRLTFNATTGELVEKRSRLHYEKTEQPTADSKGTVKGNVHLRNPQIAPEKVDLPYLKLKAGSSLLTTDSTGSFGLGFSLPLSVSVGLDGQYCGIVRNDGPNASLITTFSVGGSELLFDNSNSDQAERDAYRSVNFAHSFVKSLDPSLSELDRYLPVNVNLDMTCNAFYDPDSITLNFFVAGGQDCSNTAEVADVVYHEFGHRVQHALYGTALGTGADISNGALGEGFADVYSSFMRDDPRIGIGFFSDTAQLLRNCKNTAQWPNAISADVHESGTIIAGAFWDLRESIGLKEALRLFHFMMYHHPDDPDDQSQDGLYNAFSETLLATITTDDDNNDLSDGTPHLSQIIQAFKAHNITLDNSNILAISNLDDQDTAAASYPVTITTSSTGILGIIKSGTVRLHYRVNNSTDGMIEATPTSSGSVYHAEIPKLPAGSRVTYNALGVMSLTGDTITSSLGSFLVGFKTLFSDNCESGTGWQTGITGDNARTGIWELGDPFGTYSNPQDFIQQDTDHTPGSGTICFITGNQNLITQDRTPGSDDVDNGTTTLESPVITLSSSKYPVVRFWYYYSNDRGLNPGQAQFVVKLSTNQGNSWKNVLQTTASTDGWQLEAFSLASFVTLPVSSIKLRFVASDNIGALVEAGVDDLSVLDPIDELPQNNVGAQTKPDRTIPYPNPAARGSIVAAGSGITWFELYDITGKQVLHSDGGMLHVPSNLTSGIYQLKTSNNEFFPLVVVE